MENINLYLPGCFLGGSWLFQGCFKGTSRLFQEYFDVILDFIMGVPKGILRVFLSN